MRIILKFGATEHTLCHGPTWAVDNHVGPTGLQVSGPISLQVAEALRATNATPYNRANLITRVAFTVTRECASAKAAEKFCFTHIRDVLRSGTIYLLCEDNAGAYDTLTLANAVLQEPTCTQIGQSVQIAYTIIGGALT